ncbi:MAG: divalent-cation tolerance protein CutA [Alphaproteobacteria bacterium]
MAGRVQLIYSTHPSPGQARATARALVEEKLAACCNLIPGMESIYRWEGKLEQAAETVLISKTTEARAAEVVARIRALHPYEIPAILVLPVGGGDADFLGWIESGCR